MMSFGFLVLYVSFLLGRDLRYVAFMQFINDYLLERSSLKGLLGRSSLKIGRNVERRFINGNEFLGCQLTAC